jgi:hypothetical protein
VSLSWKLFFNGNARLNFTCIISYTTELFEIFHAWSTIICVWDDGLEVLILAHSFPFPTLFQFQFVYHLCPVAPFLS